MSMIDLRKSGQTSKMRTWGRSSLAEGSSEQLTQTREDARKEAGGQRGRDTETDFAVEVSASLLHESSSDPGGSEPAGNREPPSLH